MNSILIIDDNHAIRTGLCEKIPWNDHDIQVVGSFDDGHEVLKFLKTNAVDVIITDIVMPLMYGLDLTRIVRKFYPSIKIILLSAYNEFEFAQSAIKYGVYEYLTKPIDINALLTIVQNALLEKKNDEIVKEQVKMSIPVLRQKWLTQLIYGKWNRDSFQENCNYLGLQFESQYYKCILFEISNLDKINNEINVEELQVQIIKLSKHITDRFSDTETILFSTGDSKIIMIQGSNDADNENSYHELYTVLEQIIEETESKYKCNMTIGISAQVASVEHICHAYQNANNALQSKFYLGSNKVFDIKDMEVKDTVGSFNALAVHQKNIIQKVKFGSKEDVSGSIRELRDYLQQEHIGKEYFKMTTLSILVEAMQTIMEIEGAKEDLFHDQSKFFMNYEKMDTGREILEELELFLSKINGFINGLRTHKSMQIILKVKEYIEEFYESEKLALEELARRVCLNPSYLSTIFKEATGQNLIEYITEYRMKKAQEYLKQTNLLIYEVALKVGYTNQYYFSACFKKYLGMSPNEFRKRISS